MDNRRHKRGNVVQLLKHIYNSIKSKLKKYFSLMERQQTLLKEYFSPKYIIYVSSFHNCKLRILLRQLQFVFYLGKSSVE